MHIRSYIFLLYTEKVVISGVGILKYTYAVFADQAQNSNMISTVWLND